MAAVLVKRVQICIGFIFFRRVGVEKVVRQGADLLAAEVVLMYMHLYNRSERH